MNTKGNNRSVRRTREKLRRGLTELLQDKAAKDITVRELAERVDLNRGTFYLHYRDIFDMVEQLESELFLEFRAILDAHPTEELCGEPLPFLIDLFRFLSQNADMCSALLGQNGDLAFVNKLKDLMREKCFSDWNKLLNEKDEDAFIYFYSFIVSGCVGLFQTWLETGRREEPETMAALAEAIITSGAGMFHSSFSPVNGNLKSQRAVSV